MRSTGTRSRTARGRFAVTVVGAPVACAMLLAACGSSSSAGGSATPASGASAASESAAGSAAPSGSAAGAAVTVDFWAFVPKIEESVDLWNSTHPGVHVNFTRPASESALNQKLQAAVTAGSGAPDVVQVAYQNLNTFATSGLLEDVTADAQGYKDQFVPWTWNQVNIGGKVYGLPQDVGPMAMLYNKKLFAKYGVEVPTTWDAFKAAAQKIHTADPSVYITDFPPDGQWFAGLAWQNGAKWFDTSTDAWKVSINDAKSKQVADYWHGLVKDKLVKTEPDFSPAWNKDLDSGKILTWLTAAWGPAVLQSAAPTTKGDWAAAPIPQWTAGGSAAGNWGGSADVVVKGSKNAKAAVQFVDWLNSDPASLALLTDPTKGGLYPAAKGGQELTSVLAANPFFGGQTINTIFGQAAGGVNPSWVWGPTMDQVFNDIGDTMTKAQQSGGTLSSALDTTQANTVKAITARGLSVAP